MSSPNFVNRTLFQGDNLKYLRLLESESVNLIATDPPFNKGRDFHATSTTPSSLQESKGGGSFIDRWSWDDNVQQVWLDELEDTNLMTAIRGVRDTHSNAMGAYLCYMAVRLLEMKRVLKNNGSIYLHCDLTASHYLKMIMDAVFGWDNFRNEIVWYYGGPAKLTDRFPRKHDVLLFYSKSKDVTFNHIYDDIPQYLYDRARKDPGTNRLWVDQRLGVTGETLEKLRAENRTFITKTGKERRKQYLDEMNGKPTNSVWSIPILNSQSKERKDAKGYPTQKPLALYKRIIEASSNPGDVVLDPFCGCATTLIAAEVTGRDWIGIDLWDEVYDTVEYRLVNMGTDLEGSSGLVKDKDMLPMFDLAKITKITDPSQVKNPYEGEPESPYQESIKRYKDAPKETWQKIPKPRMVEELAYNEQKAKNKDEAYCGGCGRSVYYKFMHLDHINPKADGGANDLSNRILLCPPCNNHKRDHRTIRGLWDYNKRNDWMYDEPLARAVREKAKQCSLRVKNDIEKNMGKLPPLNKGNA